MTKYSKPSKSIFSLEAEEQVKDIISKTIEFKNVAESVLLPYKTRTEIDKTSQLLERVLERFPVVVREISRRHDNRPSFGIRDEYDVQDFLRGLLRIFFDDIRDEEWTPSFAGASARMDLLLKNEQIVIEVKMAHKGVGEKQIREQLIIDKAYYKGHKDCKKLYFFIYDPEGRIKNPRGFEKDLSDRIGDFETKVLIVPR
jgi:hypothetical protein